MPDQTLMIVRMEQNVDPASGRGYWFKKDRRYRLPRDVAEYLIKQRLAILT